MISLIDRDELISRFLEDGRNSSHVVWLFAELRYFTASNQWLFAYQDRLGVRLIALEPLIPSDHSRTPLRLAAELDLALRELGEFSGRLPLVFAGIGPEFQRLLARRGFSTIKTGEEPWITDPARLARGNSGKGVRAARNQAIRAGLRVEEWNMDDIGRSLDRRSAIEEIARRWRRRRWMRADGFLNATAPLEHVPGRRYFVARSPARLEAVLVVSPVPAAQRAFLEDLLYLDDVARGTNELLVSEAIATLARDGVTATSLGVVSLRRPEHLPDGAADASGDRRRTCFNLTFRSVLGLVSIFYRARGVETFRKRFGPQLWTPVYVCARDPSGKVSWTRALGALVLAFQPRLALSPAAVAAGLKKIFRKTPFTISWALLVTAVFALVNRGGSLPRSVLEQIGFFPNAPLIEWLHRSVLCDLLSFDRLHFFSSLGIGLLLFRGVERKFGTRFVLGFYGTMSVLDDWINYWIIIRPTHLFHRELFERLATRHEVGSSLILVTCFGLLVTRLRRVGDLLFALITVSLVLTLAFSARQLPQFLPKSNYILFFAIGYIIGKVHFEWIRRTSRRMARRAPPRLSRSEYVT